MNSFLEIYLITKLINALTSDWTSLPAYKLGIIDKNGKQLKKSYELKTTEERNAFSLLHRFAFNLKRLIETFPGGKTRLAKYLAAYALLREDQIADLDKKFLEESQNINSVFETYLGISDENL
jgi:hypothetical protein